MAVLENDFYNYEVIDNKFKVTFKDKFKDALDKTIQTDYSTWIVGTPLPNPMMYFDKETIPYPINTRNMFSSFNNITEIDLSEWYFGYVVTSLATMFQDSSIKSVYTGSDYDKTLLDRLVIDPDEEMSFLVRVEPKPSIDDINNQLLVMKRGFMDPPSPVRMDEIDTPDFYIVDGIESPVNGGYIDTKTTILNTKDAVELDIDVTVKNDMFIFGARKYVTAQSSSCILLKNYYNDGIVSIRDDWHGGKVQRLNVNLDEKNNFKIKLYKDYYEVNRIGVHRAWGLGTAANPDDDGSITTYIGAANTNGTLTTHATQYKLNKFHVYDLDTTRMRMALIPIELKNEDGTFTHKGALFDAINMEYIYTTSPGDFKTYNRIGYGYNDGRMFLADGTPYIWWEV